VLEAVDFSGGTGAASLLEAVGILRELNARKERKVPGGAPEGFVIGDLRMELEYAVVAGQDAALRFELDPIELEVPVAVERRTQ
jgi:Trypsin-co-occurring domain 2